MAKRKMTIEKQRSMKITYKTNNDVRILSFFMLLENDRLRKSSLKRCFNHDYVTVIKIFRMLLVLINKVSNVDHIIYRITAGNCLTHIVTHDECITNEELFYYLEKMVALGKCVSWVQKKTDFHDCLEKTLNLLIVVTFRASQKIQKSKTYTESSTKIKLNIQKR